MYPELFRIPFTQISVHSYGLMLVVGLLLAMELAKFLARRSDLNPEHFATAAIIALLSGLVGARIAYVIQFHREFTGGTMTQNVWNAINLTSGGLVYYGGLLLAIPTLIVYAILNRIPVLRGMDIVAPCVMVGLAFGRVGCFLNGCCWGQHCSLPAPLTVTFPYQSNPYIDDFKSGRIEPDPALFKREFIPRQDRLITPDEVKQQRDLIAVAAAERSLPVINTQLISTITALMIAGICVCYYTLGGSPGRGWALMMMLEGPTRALIEGLRTEPTYLGPLTLSMIIGLGIAAAGVVMWFVCGHFGRERIESMGDQIPSV